MVLIIVANGQPGFDFSSKAKKFENFEIFFFGVPQFWTKIFCFKIPSSLNDWKELGLSVNLTPKLKPYH